MDLFKFDNMIYIVNMCRIKIFLPIVKCRDMFRSCKVPYSKIYNVLRHMFLTTLWPFINFESCAFYKQNEPENT